MAEKTTKKTTAAKTTATKTTAVKKTAAAKKTTAAAPRAAATVTAVRPAVRKTVTRKRAAATVSHTAAATQAVTGWRRFHRKTKVGVVVSAKQARTVIVTVERLREHPLYKKVVRVRKRFAAHDDAGDVREGDLVRIQESRPYSATKRWRVVEVISRLGEAGAAAPRVADVEKALEESEGVTEILSKPAEEADEETEETEA
ncbi:MAG TPA: 30S ribosomal protein S17 [Candidatus Limnocylindria bacterium]|nr:30S ribosomal protein S17 [Candidatus Limnocylindria bacterium]